MPLSENGEALRKRLFEQKALEAHAALDKKRAAALSHPPGDYNVMAPIGRLARVLKESMETWGRAVIDSAIEAFEAEDSPLTEIDTKELAITLAEIVATRRDTAMGEFDNRGRALGPSLSAHHAEFAREAQRVIGKLTNELEIYRLKRNLEETRQRQTPAPSPTATEEHAPTPAKGPHTFQEGELVGSRYKVKHFIASGGMGEVYKVFDQTLGEDVALKTILPSKADPTAAERLFREVRMSRKVSHKNVCRVHDVGTLPDHSGKTIYFLTMELLSGQTLKQWMTDKGETPLHSQQILPIAQQIAEGLDAIHDKGIVHRDLNPGNIFLEEGGRTLIMDLGLAKPFETFLSHDDISSTGMVVGTPGYIAPEQLRGEKATAATDIWAFGVLLFRVTTGTLPFAKEELDAVLRPPPAPRSIVPGFDQTWERVILKCLELRPEDRFRSAGELCAALNGPSGESRATTAVLPAEAVSAKKQQVAAPAELTDEGPLARRPPDIPAAVFKKIQDKAERDWPDNFDMRLFAINSAIESYRKLYPEPTRDDESPLARRPPGIPTAAFKKIQDKAERDWPDNFDMRLFAINSAIESYRKLYHSEPPRVSISSEALSLLRAAAAGNGEITVLETDQLGKWVRVGHQDFIDSFDPAVAARHHDALKALVRQGLVRHEQGGLFVLTAAGFEYARALQP